MRVRLGHFGRLHDRRLAGSHAGPATIDSPAVQMSAVMKLDPMNNIPMCRAFTSKTNKAALRAAVCNPDEAVRAATKRPDG